ncbi:unnamed protein product [Tenebrio molitor]|jgi:hypothetical protein|nr:unnamed protein product [Tenebrio molitor]
MLYMNFVICAQVTKLSLHTKKSKKYVTDKFNSTMHAVLSKLKFGRGITLV